MTSSLPKAHSRNSRTVKVRWIENAQYDWILVIVTHYSHSHPPQITMTCLRSHVQLDDFRFGNHCVKQQGAPRPGTKEDWASQKAQRHIRIIESLPYSHPRQEDGEPGAQWKNVSLLTIRYVTKPKRILLLTKMPKQKIHLLMKKQKQSRNSRPKKST